MGIRSRIQFHELDCAFVVSGLQMFVARRFITAFLKQNGFGIAFAEPQRISDGFFDSAGMVNEFKKNRFGGCGGGCSCRGLVLF